MVANDPLFYQFLNLALEISIVIPSVFNIPMKIKDLLSTLKLASIFSLVAEASFDP